MKKRLVIAVLCAVSALFISACSDKGPAPTVFTSDDMDGKTIGVLVRSVAGVYAASSGTVREYASDEALVSELRAGILDCAVLDGEVASRLIKKERRLKALDEPFMAVEFCIVTAKESRDLLADINTALQTLRDNGTLTGLRGLYINGVPYEYTPRTDIDASAGSLRLAVPDAFPPYSYMDENGELCGFDITLAQAVCDVLGVRLELVVTDRGDIEKKVWSARADFGMGGLYKPAEGDNIVDYSDGYTDCTLKIITRK